MTETRFSSLRLVQFRSYGKAALELDGRPIVLTGQNGSGKTSILEAVSMFSPGRGMRRAVSDEMACRRNKVGWKVSAELVAGGRGWEVATWFPGSAGRRVEIEGKAARQVDLGRLLRVVWAVPAMDRLWSESGDGRRRFLDRLAMGFFPAHSEDVIAYEKAMRERNRLIRERRRVGAWMDGLEQQMAERGTAIARSRRRTIERLKAAGKESDSGFPSARLTVISPDGGNGNTEDPKELAEALKLGRHRDFAAGRTLVGPHRSDLLAVHETSGMEARNCSTGEQMALLLSIILANARAISEDCGGPPVMLLDEIAAHLDAGRRDRFFSEILRLKVQAWLTGTQSDYFNSLGLDTQWFEVTETNGLSTVVETKAPSRPLPQG